MELKTLSDTPVCDILDAFQKAFGDYAVRFDNREVESMLQRRGFNPDISWGAFEDNEICAFILNGYGVHDGVLCSYDCGTGTLPGHRGLGLAGRLFRESLPALRDAGVERYILEVLTTNTPAVNLYRKAGFEVDATYECYHREVGAAIPDPSLPDGVTVDRVDADALEPMAGFCDFVPSWQNSLASIKRGANELTVLAACHRGEKAGYCVCDTRSGDIAQIAVDRKFRRLGIGTSLMWSALRLLESPKAKVLNVDDGCGSMREFLAAMGFDKGLSQYGMRMEL